MPFNLPFLKGAAPAHAVIPLALTKDHGAVLAVLVLTVLTINGWMAVQVGKARRRYGVPYPAMYGPAGTPDGDRFSCIQRGHMNTIEAAASHYALLLTAGLVRPVPAAAAGAVWLAGRVAYFLGYATGVPAARSRGAFGHLGSLALLVITARTACSLMRS